MADTQNTPPPTTPENPPVTPPATPPAGDPPAAPPADDSAKLRAELADAQRKLQAFEKGQQEAEAKRLEEQGKYKELAEKHRADAVAAKAAFSRERVRNALLAAAGEAADAALVADILERGGAVGDDGAVTISGKPPVEAVKELLTAKPFLRKSGPQGGGAPAGGAPAPGPDLNVQLAEAKKRGDLAAVIRLTGEIGRQKPKS